MKDDDAIIIHYLTKYKLNKFKKVIFPKESLKKIIDLLNTYGINYQIQAREKHIFIGNKYNEYKNIAYEKLMIEDRLNIIINKIEQLHGNDLMIFLRKIEDYLNE